MASIPLTSGTLIDTNGPCAFTNYVQFTLRTGSTLTGMVDRYHISVWDSPAGSLAQANDAEDRPQWTSYSARVNGVSTNIIPLSIGTGQEPAQFFQLVSR